MVRQCRIYIISRIPVVTAVDFSERAQGLSQGTRSMAGGVEHEGVFGGSLKLQNSWVFVGLWWLRFRV